VTRDAPSGTREEIEVKLPARELGVVRERLIGVGATLRAPRHDESNDLYDDAERKISGSGRAVRLRRAAGRAILTYKGHARFEGGEAEAILRGLGLERRFRYEKRREEWNCAGCVVALDETPIGDFVEVEGQPPAIRKVIADLALDPAEAIPYSYPELYARRRKEEPGLPPDMVWKP